MIGAAACASVPCVRCDGHLERINSSDDRGADKSSNVTGNGRDIPTHTLGGDFQEAMSWDADKAALIGRSARTAWRVRRRLDLRRGQQRRVAGAHAVEARRAICGRVDNTTGIVDVVPVFAGHARMDEAVTRYFLTHYVSVCDASISPRRRATTRSAERSTQPSAIKRGMPVEPDQSRVADQCSQGWEQRARSGRVGEALFSARQARPTSRRCHTSRPIRQGPRAEERPLTGSRPFSTRCHL